MPSVTEKLERLIDAAPEIGMFSIPERTPEDDAAAAAREAQKLAWHLADRGFPRRHIHALDSMHGPGLEKARELEPRVKGGDCLLILCGDRGPGKTQIATWWASRFGKAVRYFRAHDLIRAIRGDFSDDRAARDDARQALQNARNAGLLVLDEFSELALSDYERRTLTNILDHRYGEMMATVIITNTPPDRVASEVGRSVLSRCQESGGIINCDWPSYRA